MFRKVLIANRGEIAVRIARSVRAAGAEAIAVHSAVDRHAVHVRACDLAVNIGGATAAESYLDMDKILAAAKASGAQAIHPGYGFLSENAVFAARCEAAGLTFIGPSPAAIELMGNKRAAKMAVEKADVPCIPGYQGTDQSDAKLVAEAQRIGLPLMVKAAAGGGGRGMRVVRRDAELREALTAARSEARNAFGDDELILERAISDGRHIEIQVAADAHGNVIHLGERDCSLQRRHQKVIEEAPSPFVDEALREAMGQAAVNAARACSYLGVGTVEFLVAQDRTFSFLEMNTRLQVEHPVTELITGVDLVEWQLRIAEGEPLPLTQAQVRITGHAIEARLYAEDPADDFMPHTGRILRWTAPDGDGIRVDAGVASGSEISPYYDPMIAKIIAYGSDREQARRRLARALERTVLLGVVSNQSFLNQLLRDEVFIRGAATTTYIDDAVLARARELAHLQDLDIALATVLLLRALDPQPEHFLNWSNSEVLPRHRLMVVNDVEHRVSVTASGSDYAVGIDERVVRITALGSEGEQFRVVVDGVERTYQYAFDGERLCLAVADRQIVASDATYRPARSATAASSGQIVANTEGQLVQLAVSPGEQVTKGQLLAVVEAMKMAHRHVADGDGVVEAMPVTLNTQVKKGQLLVALRLNQDEEAA